MEPYLGWNNLLERINEEMKETLKLRGALGPYEPSFKCELVVGTVSRLVIYSLSDLHNARSLLRHAFGGWQDKLTGRFFSLGKTITTWENEREGLAIWLEVKPQDYPQALMKDGCKWVPVGDWRGKEYRFVCSVEGEG